MNICPQVLGRQEQVMFGVTGVHLSVLVGQYGMSVLKQPISLKWRPVFY